MYFSDSENQQKIKKLIKALGIDLDFTGKEIADILWLSLKRQELLELESSDIITEDKINLLEEKEEDKDNKEEEDECNKFSPKQKDSLPTPIVIHDSKIPVYPNVNKTEEEKKRYGKSELPIRIPDPPSIPQPLEFAKALRPLMQKVSSGRDTILDEHKTVEYTAKNNGIFIPILKAEPEPWLDLVLVIEEYKSMTLWQHTIKELKKLLKHYGIFREIKICGLYVESTDNQELNKKENTTKLKPTQNSVFKHNIDSSQQSKKNAEGEKSEIFFLRYGIGKKSQFANPKELVDTTGRRLILVVSDCVASYWHDGSILPILQQWVKYQPLAVLQMLPNWMWRRTGLRLGASVQFKNLVAGNSNQNLIIKELLLWKNISLEQGIKIPVLTLEPELARDWSELLAGKHNALASGFVLPHEIKVKSENLPQNRVEQLNPEKRVQRFRTNASPIARKLAGLLSAAPVIYLPVARMIKASLLPQAQPIHVAEVFLGGLLKPTTEVTPDTNSDQVEYQFVNKDTRQLLFDNAPVSDSQRVFDAVSLYLEKYFGKSIYDIVALLNSNNDSEKIPPFAEVALDLLKQLEGDYAEFAKKIEEGRNDTQEDETTSPQLNKLRVNVKTIEIDDISEIDLKTFEFEPDIAIIIFEEDEDEEKLQQWEFETVTVNRRGEVINRQIQSNYYFKENLADNIDLEMVAIAGGTFIMGSPESEKNHRNSESPQHQVTVSDFFMGKYPITQAQWRAIASREDLKVKIDLKPEPSNFKENPSSFAYPETRSEFDLPYYKENPTYLDRPVEQVNWYEAVEFCERLSKLTGRKYRLPSEAEWEYACRAIKDDAEQEVVTSQPEKQKSWWGNITGIFSGNQEQESQSESLTRYPPFYFGDTITGDLANYNASSTYADEAKGEKSNETTPVGQFPPNANGLYDMHGNVWEWCADDWHDNYKNAPTDGSPWLDNNDGKNEKDKSYAVLRGGSWFVDPNDCRSASRYYFNARVNNYDDYGFRVVCVSGRTL